MCCKGNVAEYDRGYKDAIEKLREWYELPYESEKALRDAL